jgi:hypothetical protein
MADKREPSLELPPFSLRRGKRSDRPGLSAVPGRVAVAATGVMVGLLAVGLTSLELRLCEVVSGTSSCGGGPGLLLLLLVVAALAAVGTGLLRAFGVQAPGSTSALAVGLVAVLALLFLADVPLARWMLLVIPAVAALAFLLAHAVTAASED